MCVSRSPLHWTEGLRRRGAGTETVPAVWLTQGQVEVAHFLKYLAVEGDNKKRDLGLFIRK